MTLKIKIISCYLLLCAVMSASVRPSDEGTSADVPARLIVRLTSEAQRAISLSKTAAGVVTGLTTLDSLHRRFEVREQRRLFGRPAQKAYQDKVLSAIYILELPDTVDIVSAAKVYHSLPEVVYAEPDYRVELFNAPDDPLFPHQWYLNNVGQEYLGMNRIEGDNNDSQVLKSGTPDADIDALEVFDSTHETTLPLVGIIDTGVDTDHEDLAENVWVNPGEDINGNGLVDPEELNGADDDHNGFIDDFWGWDFSGDTYATTPSFPGDNYPIDNALVEGGHGSHCAGIVGAVSNNGIGIAGIAGPCRIMAIKVFPNALFTVCAEAIVYSADMDCDVINMSWGGPFYSYAIADAIEYAIDRGVLPVSAAGNSGCGRLSYPAALPRVLTVGASNSRDEVTYFSSYGDHVEVVAPGEDILSLRAVNTDIYEHGGAYGKEPLVHIVDDKYYLMDGTSMAGPCVAGVAAHLLAASPGLPATRIIEIIEASADDIIFPYGDTTEPYPGRDIYSGYGRVNLYSALQMLSGRLAKIDYPYHRAIVSGDVAVIGTAAGDNFTDYSLEYGAGYEPDTWTLIASSAVPFSKDTLGIWHSGDLSGLYTLRLTVGEENQALISVIADNVPTVEITSPGTGDTLTGMVSIYGSTVVSDFSAYVLEFGYGETPAAWDTVVSSTRMIADDLLGTFILNSLVSGSTGMFRLTVSTSTGGTYADSVSIYSASITSGGWFQDLTAYGAMSPTVGDITGDRNLEVVTGTGYQSSSIHSGGVFAFTCDGQPVPGWPKDTTDNIRCIPAIGDLDGDGIDDVVMPGRAYLSYAEDWPAAKAETISEENGSLGNDNWPSTAVIADLENDGEPEVLVVNRYGTVFARRWDGRPVIPGLNGKFAETPGYGGLAFGYPGVTVADLDQDGSREVIVGSADAEIEEYGGISIFDIEANVLLGPRDVPDTFSHISGFAIANFDESDDLEIIIVGAFPDCICVTAMKKDGSHLPGYPIRLEDVPTGAWFSNFPAVGDIEGDGILEMVITVWSLDEARVYAWHQDGTPLGQIEPDKSIDGTRSIQPIFATISGCMGSPILADITGDGRAEIIARAGRFFSSGYEYVMAWDAEGTVVPGFPIFALGFTEIGNSPGYIPIVSDLDHNGLADMILNSETVEARQTVVWNLEEPFLPVASPWACAMHDSWNSKLLGFDPGEYARSRHPQGLHVVANLPAAVTLGWIPKRSWISVGYNIYRSPVSGQPGVKINTSLIPNSDSTFVDSAVPGGNILYYTITNVDTLNSESPPSPELEVLIGRPSAPIGLQAQVIDNDVILTWYTNPAYENVEQYRIYHKNYDNSEFLILDSASAEPVYTHSGPKSYPPLYYRLTAVNSCGESFPGDSMAVHPPILLRSPWVREADWLDTTVALTWTVGQSGSGQGCNVYRSTVSGIYTSRPVNDNYIPDPMYFPISYTDTGLTPGRTYYYGVTQVVDGLESFLSKQVSFLAGQPHTPSLEVTNRRENITLHMTAVQESVFEGFRIYRRESDGPYVVLDPLVLESIYVDTAASSGGDYRYKITAISTRGLESAYSNEEEGCLMTMDQGLALVNLTYGVDHNSSPLWYGDSINAFYSRALQGLTYTYIDHTSLQYDDKLRLFELSSHPVAIIQAEDGDYERLWNATDTTLVLRKYLDAGGCLLIEGRRLVSGYIDGGYVDYISPGDFFYDYIGLDSVFTKPIYECSRPFIGFVGADRFAPDEDYPQTVLADTSLVNYFYGDCDFIGAVPGVDYYVPHDSADILYTYITSDDTSSMNGKPVALRHVTDNYAVIWIGFPLYFIEEDVATEILHAGLDELSIISDASDDDDDDGNIPEVFALRQNVPNPFNASTTIAYNLPRRSHVTISIYNILGQRVRTLVDEIRAAGYHRIEWGGTDEAGRKAATGIYLYRFVADDYAETKKMLLLK